MVCNPGRIQTQLPTASYQRMCLGFQTSKQWEARCITCSHCNVTLQACSLPRHLATFHRIYHQTVVAEELLDESKCITYKATQHPGSKLKCPVAGCLGVAKDGWNMRGHFWDLHPWDKVVVLKEGWSYLQCHYCWMQINLTFTGHWMTKSCALWTERRVQRNAVVTSAVALCCTSQVHGGVLETV
jgi:hypothetical protein